MTKKSKIILCVSLVIVLICTAVFTVWLAFTSNNKPHPPENEIAVTPDIGGMTIDDGNIENYGVKLMSAKIAPSAYSENGISAHADSAFRFGNSIARINY